MQPVHETRHEGAGGLSLAGAFNLMREALAQLGSAVAHDALRLRMAALHGKDDAMLTAEKFPHLLRQANDAEVADVRKVGDNEFEVSLHPTEDPRARAGYQHRSATTTAAAAPSTDGASAAVATIAAPVLDVAPRFGIRSRTGARPGSRPPLVGVVRLDDDAPVAVAVPLEAPARKPARSAAAKADKADKVEKPVKSAKSARTAKAEPAAKAKSTRPRAKAAKKPE